MIVAIVGTLEGFKEKLQRTIDHVKSGVTHLNEDQKETAVLLINALRGEFDEAADIALEHLGVSDGVKLIDLKPEDPPASTAGQPVPEPLKSVVDDSGPEVVHLSSIWHQHDDAGKEVEVHVEKPGVIVPEPAKE